MGFVNDESPVREWSEWRMIEKDDPPIWRRSTKDGELEEWTYTDPTL